MRRGKKHRLIFRTIRQISDSLSQCYLKHNQAPSLSNTKLEKKKQLLKKKRKKSFLRLATVRHGQVLVWH